MIVDPKLPGFDWRLPNPDLPSLLLAKLPNGDDVDPSLEPPFMFAAAAAKGFDCWLAAANGFAGAEDPAVANGFDFGAACEATPKAGDDCPPICEGAPKAGLPPRPGFPKAGLFPKPGAPNVAPLVALPAGVAPGVLGLPKPKPPPLPGVDALPNAGLPKAGELAEEDGFPNADVSFGAANAEPWFDVA